MTPEQVQGFFTRSDGQYLFARWGRPIVPVVFGVEDATLGVVKGAIEAVVVLAGHKMAETDPELGANLMMFFFQDWAELPLVPKLDQLVPDLGPLCDRLAAAGANQYRAFRFDADGAIKAAFPEIHVVMLTGFADGAALAGALEAGCAGFVSKGGRFDELLATIEAVHDGQVRVPQDLLEGLVTHLRPRSAEVGHDLTAREVEVLRMLADGWSTNEMMEHLIVSIHTVRNHIRNLLTKLHASSRLEAVAVATKAGLIERA